MLIGNAAAALQGAPVTTVDFDFLFRKTPTNLRKLKALARALDGTILRPYYPASDLYRIVRERDGLQLDFMVTIHGIRSLEGLRARALTVEIDGVHCQDGQVIALLDGKLVAAPYSVDEACALLLGKAKASEHELITFYYGQDMSHADANRIADIMREKYREQEIEVQEGAGFNTKLDKACQLNI